jgi:glycosyltransferase involved in cell wall biosynthesis
VKRILIMNSFYTPLVLGGAELSVQQVAESLIDRYAVTVVCRSRDGGFSRDNVNGVDVVRVPFFNVDGFFDSGLSKFGKAFYLAGEAFNPRRDHFLRRLLDELKPDLLNTHNLLELSTEVWKYAARRGCPVIHTIHDRRMLCPWLMYRNGSCKERCAFCKLYGLRDRLHSRAVNHVVGVSRNVLDVHLAAGFFPNAKTSVINNAVRDHWSGPHHRGESVVFGYIGTLSRAKGLEVLLDAWKGMPEKSRLLVAGKGAKDYEEKLRREYPLPNVSYVGYADPSEFLRGVDVLVVPSLYLEGFGRVVIEAFSAGVPVIASRSGPFPEIIEEGVTGWLFENGDADDLRRVAGSVAATDTATFDERDAACRKHYLDSYREETMFGKYRDLFGSYIG